MGAGEVCCGDGGYGWGVAGLEDAGGGWLGEGLGVLMFNGCGFKCVNGVRILGKEKAGLVNNFIIIEFLGQYFNTMS